MYPALQIIKDLLERDPTLKDRTVMGVKDIILLLEYCLKHTYFSFQGQFFGWVRVWLWVPHGPHSSKPLHGVLGAGGSGYGLTPQVLAQVCG